MYRSQRDDLRSVHGKLHGVCSLMMAGRAVFAGGTQVAVVGSCQIFNM